MPSRTDRFLAFTFVLFSLATAHAAEPIAKVPLGLPAIVSPKDNPLTPEKVELGKQLYFDNRLSRDMTISCASCHDPAKGYSNGADVAEGFGGAKGGRNAPTVLNTAYQTFQFWDGRAGSLEEQALGPLQNPIEMNMTLDLALSRLKGIKGYRDQFQKVFGTEVNEEGVAKAIAAYERTVLAGDSNYDRYKAGDSSALTVQEKKGMDLFFGKANCSSCHAGPNFTDNAFHNIGVGMNQAKPDVGRAEISKLEGDTGAFKTPTCRDLALSGPYMHDGSLKTLKEVVEHYNKGGHPNDYLDEEIYPLNLTTDEIDALVIFMETGLRSHQYPDHKPPKLPE
jgi:cytochrome c peroxidase